MKTSFTPHGGPIFKVAFSPGQGSGLLATAGLDKTAKLWDAQNGKIRFDFPHTNAVTDVAFSPDGERLATASLDKKVKIWEVSSGELLLTISHSAEVTSVAFSPGRHASWRRPLPTTVSTSTTSEIRTFSPWRAVAPALAETCTVLASAVHVPLTRPSPGFIVVADDVYLSRC